MTETQHPYTITDTLPAAEAITTPAPSYATNKLFPHRHSFTLRLDLDKVYFQCEGCSKKLTVLEAERILNQ